MAAREEEGAGYPRSRWTLFLVFRAWRNETNMQWLNFGGLLNRQK
jgi:hypothetical protein